MNNQIQPARCYNSPPTSLNSQLNRLEKRGLLIADRANAKQFLSQVSYYRFAGYALPYEIFSGGERTHQYRPDSTFEQVVYLYEFDSDLRTLLFKATEFIEIAFRTQLCLHTSLETGDSHWYLNESLFKAEFKEARQRGGQRRSQYEWFLDACKNESDNSKELFIQSYKNTYTAPETPASWMMIEIMSLGIWSRVYKGLKPSKAKTKTAKHFGLKPQFLTAWIYSVSVLRNSCAHHSRLWNKPLSIRPRLTTEMQKHYTGIGETNRIALVLDIISELLKPLGRYNWFIDQLNQLFMQYPDIPYESMGLKANHFTKEKGVRV